MKKYTSIEEWDDDAYDRWKDEQLDAIEEEKDRIRAIGNLDFIDLPVKEFEKYVDEMVANPKVINKSRHHGEKFARSISEQIIKNYKVKK